MVVQVLNILISANVAFSNTACNLVLIFWNFNILETKWRQQEGPANGKLCLFVKRPNPHATFHLHKQLISIR